MNIFKEFDEVLVLEGLLTIVFIEDNIKKFCKSKIKQIEDDLIHISIESKNQIPKDQVLSIIYSSEKGLYGFHAKLISSLKEGYFSISKPKEGWQIQRRKYDRINMVNKAMVLGQEKDSKEEESLIFNLGDLGMAFQSSLDLSAGQEINIAINIDSVILKEDCVVVWKAEIPEKDQEYGYKYLYGVKFLFINSKLKKKIIEIKKKYELL